MSEDKADLKILPFDEVRQPPRRIRWSYTIALTGKAFRG